jgi:hypothetical protein
MKMNWKSAKDKPPKNSGFRWVLIRFLEPYDKGTTVYGTAYYSAEKKKWDVQKIHDWIKPFAVVEYWVDLLRKPQELVEKEDEAKKSVDIQVREETSS